MCGITGFYDPARGHSDQDLTALVTDMATAIAHRGPDGFGAWTDQTSGLALGHRRLAIIDLSQDGAQPMASANGRYVLAYNGEVYNFADLRLELEAKGHSFRGHSDTEVVLAGIVEWGFEATIQRCIGMFAVALWDRETRSLTLARDRMGIKPLYYGWVGGVFVFGSELSALEAHPAFRREIDQSALALYMVRNCIPAPHSIYKGVQKLTAGAYLIINTKTIEPGVLPPVKTFWSLADVVSEGLANPFQGSEDEATDQLEELLKTAVGDRMVADRPLGVFLSGGIDSSTVASLMQSISTDPVKTFSIGFHDEGYNEARHAKAVAAHLGTDHTELYIDPATALDVVPKLPTLYDEPFADSSQLPTYLVSEMARRDVVVCLSGDGGDELFGGYNRYMWVNAIAQRTNKMPGLLTKTLAAGLTSLSPQTWDQAFDTLSPVLPGKLRQRNPGDKLHKMAGILTAGSEAEIYRGLVGHWRPEDHVMKSARPAQTIVEQQDRWPDLPDITQQMMYLDAVTYMADDILTKVDRASMAVGLEARVPLIDHRVAAFAWSLPMAFKTGGGVGKRVLRNVLYRHVPKDLVERPKMGFALPIHDWLRGPLRDWAENLLDEKRLAQGGYFNAAPIRQKWDEHLSGKRNWQHHLWDVLMFQAWAEEKKL
jgi:asparagine synthase (glutamine-hydrolysing)